MGRKIKHIVAKLVGASEEETLDVYDVDALHSGNIANNLTTTSSGYVLDARQGKALNDNLTTVNTTLSTVAAELTRQDSPTSGGQSAFTAFVDGLNHSKLYYFRMRSALPTSAYNYSPGLILNETDDQAVVVLFGLNANGISILRKSSATWESSWNTIYF